MAMIKRRKDLTPSYRRNLLHFNNLFWDLLGKPEEFRSTKLLCCASKTPKPRGLANCVFLEDSRSAGPFWALKDSGHTPLASHLCK